MNRDRTPLALITGAAGAALPHIYDACGCAGLHGLERAIWSRYGVTDRFDTRALADRAGAVPRRHSHTLPWHGGSGSHARR